MTDVEYYLNQVDWLNKKIENKMIEVEQLRQMAYGVSAMNTEADRVQKSTDKDQMSRIVAKIVDKEQEANDLVDRMFKSRDRIIRQLEEMDEPRYYHVLYGKYVARKSMTAISDEVAYSRKQTYRLVEKAEKAFYDKYSSEIVAYRYARRKELSQNVTS